MTYKQKTLLLKNGFVVTENGISQQDICLCDGRIDLLYKTDLCEEVIDLAGLYILPGFIDIHFHGYNLFDFTFGRYNPVAGTFDDSYDAYEKGFKMLSENLPRFGVTGAFLGSDAAIPQVLNNCFSNLAWYMKDHGDVVLGARILGGLLEGSFINPEMCGAMNADRLLDFSPEAFNSIEDSGSIKLANVVPDFGQKSLDLIKYLTEKGIVVGAGHTNATAKQFRDAVESGLKYCIHFTNGPTGGSYKPFDGGGTVEAVLQCDEVYAELIADGYHVSPAYIRDIIKRKGVDRIIGITDCMFVADSSVKRFEIDGVKGYVSDNGNYLAVANKKNTLFGSNLTMDRAVENMLNWLCSPMDGIWERHYEAIDFLDAIMMVSRIYSTNPCELTGLHKEGMGKITHDGQADLCVLSITGQLGDYKVQIEKTLVSGNLVYSKS